MKLVQMMIWGLLFSLAASYGTMTMIAVGNEEIIFSGSDMLQQFVIASVLGPVIGLGSIIFRLERFPIILQLFLHFVYITVCVFIAGKIGGWYEGQSPLSVANVLLIEIIIYILVWLVLYIMTQRDIKVINQKIKSEREGKR